MKSVNNNWLTFSLQSPHLSLDAVQQADPASQPRTVSSLLSKMSQNHSNTLGGYQGSATDCYSSLGGDGAVGNSNSGQTLESMRADGSLCIMEALSRSHSAG